MDTVALMDKKLALDLDIRVNLFRVLNQECTEINARIADLRGDLWR